jgi:hypothetical protein
VAIPPLVLPYDADPLAWADLLARQHRAVTAAQAREFGIGRRLATAQVEAGRWTLWLPRVYLVGVPAPRRPTRLSAALLYGGPSAVLSHRTAAEEWGLLPRSEEPVHITLPYGPNALTQPGRLLVHRTHAALHTGDTDPPRTSKVDTVLDIAADEPDEATAATTLVTLMEAAKLRPKAVVARMSARRPRRHSRALRSAVP